MYAAQAGSVSEASPSCFASSSQRRNHSSGQGMLSANWWSERISSPMPRSAFPWEKASAKRRNPVSLASYCSSRSVSSTSLFKMRSSSSPPTRKAGSTSRRSACSRSTERQKLSMVVICTASSAASSRLARAARPVLPSRTAASRLSSMRRRIRSRISAAAARVKVIMSRRSMSTGRVSSNTRDTMRSVRTAVFPLPAAAEINRRRSESAMALPCSSVQRVIRPPPHSKRHPSRQIPLPPSASYFAAHDTP